MRRIPIICSLLLLAVLAGCGGSDTTAPSTPSSPETAANSGVRAETVAVPSEAVGRELSVGVLVPEHRPRRDRPLLVFLHGAGGSSASFLENEAVTGTLGELGREAPVMAFPEGEESWWHERASGDWERYVVGEVIPAVSARYDVDPRRVAIGGISMGGYGAFHLGLAYPGRFCAVGGHSAGLWPHRGEEFPGAFDDRGDYLKNDVLAAVRADPGAYGETPVWNDYGDEDWFVAGNAAFVAALRQGGAELTAKVWPGGHDAAYWDAHWPRYLHFYATALANC